MWNESFWDVTPWLAERYRSCGRGYSRQLTGQATQEKCLRTWNVIKMGSHSVRTRWMYQYCVLIFGLMMVQRTEVCRRVFNIDYQYILCYWLNKLLWNPSSCFRVATSGQKDRSSDISVAMPAGVYLLVN